MVLYLGYLEALSRAQQGKEPPYNISTVAVPRHHLSKGRQGRRRSHLALKAKSLTTCSHCKKAILPHVVCKFCGYYNGREVINVLAKELKRQEKQKHRQQA